MFFHTSELRFLQESSRIYFFSSDYILQETLVLGDLAAVFVRRLYSSFFTIITFSSWFCPWSLDLPVLRTVKGDSFGLTCRHPQDGVFVSHVLRLRLAIITFGDL